MVTENKLPHRIVLYRDRSVLRKWRYRVMAGNNKQVGKSEQGFVRRSYAIKRAKKQFPNSIVILQD